MSRFQILYGQKYNPLKSLINLFISYKKGVGMHNDKMCPESTSKITPNTPQFGQKDKNVLEKPIECVLFSIRILSSRSLCGTTAEK